ncbi:dCTP deaminase, partial [Candidatus Gracilibacteria bacterium]
MESGDLVVESLIGKDIFEQIGPASLDFRLGNTFKVYRKSRQ